MERFDRFRPLGALTAIALCAAMGLMRPAGRAEDEKDSDDQVLLSFSTVGDSRQDPDTPDPTTLPLSGQDKIWLQNTRAWARIIAEIERQDSHLLVFNGDMVMGYGNAAVPADTSTVAKILGSDLVKIHRQYGFWRGMVAGLMEKGTYVVPVAGNHEVQWKKAPLPGGGTAKLAQAVNEDAWRANMSDLVLDDARFQDLFGVAPANEAVGDNRASGPGDGPAGATLATDQSKLTYSFDFQGCHFVVIDTDPVGNDFHAPVNWLSGDLAAAAARGVQHIFVFGHKPAFTYYFGDGILPGNTLPLPAKPSGLDNDLAARDAFWAVIEAYNATYFCGHEHIFHLSQPTRSSGGKAWQILVGSGGSPFEAGPTDATIDPKTDRTYAWATVKVTENGKVKITAYGFNDDFGPTRVLQTITIKR